MTRTLKIGEVARAAGVRVDTVRFYERRGVLAEAARQASGYRAFTPAAVERIRFAKQLQSLGFSLDEVVETLRSVDRGAASCASEQRHLASALARVDEQLAALESIRSRLAGSLDQCRDGSCTLLDAAGAVRVAERR